MASQSNERPLVSFILLAYNQEQYIREAVEGALSQTYSPLEIILSDDSSTDRTFEIMKEMTNAYRGPHMVKTRRESINLGLTAHMNQALGVTSGVLIVLAAGDDISFTHRVSAISQRWINAGKPKCCIHSNAEIFFGGDTDSVNLQQWKPVNPHKFNNLKDVILGQHYVLGATEAISRHIFTEFPPINASIQNEDVIFTIRAAAQDGCLYINESLIKYRKFQQTPQKKGRNLSPSDYYDEIAKQIQKDLMYIGKWTPGIEKAVNAVSIFCLARSKENQDLGGTIRDSIKSMLKGIPAKYVFRVISRALRQAFKRKICKL